MLENSVNLCYHSVKMHKLELSAAKLKSFAYLVGVYLGDGCLTGNSFKLNTIDREFAEATATALQDILGKKPSIREEIVAMSSNPNYSLYLNAPELLFLKEDSERKQIIPSFVYDWDKETTRYFLRGIMDSEGYISFTKGQKTLRNGTIWRGTRYEIGIHCTDGFMLDLPIIFKKLGIKHSSLKRGKPYKDHYRIPMRYHINKESWVNSGMIFTIRRKQQRVDEYAETGISYLKHFNRSETTRSLV